MHNVEQYICPKCGPEDYAKNYWRKFESDIEHQERVQNAEDAAAELFRSACAAQLKERDDALAFWWGDQTAVANRKRDQIRAQFKADTQEASDLFLVTCNEIMRDGEMSEATSLAWDALMESPKMVCVGDHTPEILNVEAV